MVKELRFLLDKPSGLWLQNGSTLWQFCTLGGVETKIDHLLFISSFDQWIDLQDAIIGFEKNENMVIWKNVKDLYLGLFYSSTPFTNYTLRSRSSLLMLRQVSSSGASRTVVGQVANFKTHSKWHPV